MHVGIVMPVVLQTQSCYDMTLEAIRRLRFKNHNLIREKKIDWTFHLMCNRIDSNHYGTSDSLVGTQQDPGPISKACNFWNFGGPFALSVVTDKERTVSGAWNEGAKRAIQGGAEVVICLANDCWVEPGTLDHLAWYARTKHESVSLWSGCSRENSSGEAYETEGADFTCFAFTPATLAVHGAFDENFKPAYFEDNDYHARIALAGDTARVLHRARFEHVGGGSQTSRNDEEMAHHVKHWWIENQDYFVQKWGRLPAGTESEIKSSYHKTPFNSGQPLWHWELEDNRK